MAKTTVKILIDPQKNSLTFSKNFRIFSTHEPVSGIIEFTDFIEEIITTSPDALDLSFLKRHFRYSRNKLDWSLWYEVEPGNLGDAANILLDKGDPFYFEIKYEYDDGSDLELSSIIQINEIKLRFKQGSSTPATFSPVVVCSDEKCNSIITNRDPSFRPYEVDSAIGIYQELSFFTNQLYGHQVVYFRTLPESDSGDYVFKEWTLYKNVDRKCLKVMVPKNAFPSNAPKFAEFGMDFQLPFEIHLDHKYFQSVFGSESEPRKRDFLYFPLINRMFEIQGSYLHRGFMMAPTFWKISLKKYNPNIDMLLKDETRHFLDNVILSAEQLFGDKVEDDIKDGTMPEQYKTISTTFDSSRRAIHPDVSIKPLKFTFNFASLIENFYDFTKIPFTEYSFKLTGEDPPISTSITLDNLKSLDPNKAELNDVVLAYQGSDLYTTWKNGALVTNDLNTKNASSLPIRIRGPFDTIPNNIGQSDSGRYIRIEAYRNLKYQDQRDILITSSGGEDFINLKARQTGVVYSAKPRFNTHDVKNISFTCLFNVPGDSSVIRFIEGFDNSSTKGIKINGEFIRYFNSQPEGELKLTVQINSQVKNYSIPNFISGKWHALVVSISNEFNQCGTYVYSIVDDPSDIINYTDFGKVFSSVSSIPSQEFEIDSYYSLPVSNLLISNLRLFRTMIKEDEHDFILSQQFIKDESMLILIDNCRPQLNLPYIAQNR
jgi:hypothetical protein